MAAPRHSRPVSVRLGVFVVPSAEEPGRTLAQIDAADELGLDLVGVQDHPYQRRFLDTWTLLSYAAARTRRVTLLPDVANLPLRNPAVLAKAAASLDVLSPGRVELGLGAGAFWDGIAAMGGPRLDGPASVDALEEAIAVIRGMWSGQRAVRVEGRHHRLDGVHPGPAPTRPIGIWLGAYGPRMMRVVGRLADGWLPSVPRLPPEEVAPRQAAIDEAARATGRDPAAIVRAANLTLEGDPGTWAGQALRAHRELGFDVLVLSAADAGDPLEVVQRIAQDVAPAVRAGAG
jgi:alkanesulfonate monooxygenase SsuD/methylene tetrahydromethanopterin reductase-like flavin-dependent oxidoreductase (luciferase family)